MKADVETFGHNLVGTYTQAVKNPPILASEDGQNGIADLREIRLVPKPSARSPHKNNPARITANPTFKKTP